MKTYSLLILKPGSLKKKEMVLKALEQNDIQVETMREARLSLEAVERHYAEHYGKPFYPTLVDYMVTGNVKDIVQFYPGCILMVVSSTKENENEEEFITRSRKVVKEVIRPMLALKRENYKYLSEEDFKEVSMTANGIHASDSPKSAEREINNFFPEFFDEKEID